MDVLWRASWTGISAFGGKQGIAGPCAGRYDPKMQVLDDLSVTRLQNVGLDFLARLGCHVFLPVGQLLKGFAGSSACVKSTATYGSSPMTQMSWPGGMSKMSPALSSRSVPSTIRTPIRPETT